MSASTRHPPMRPLTHRRFPWALPHALRPSNEFGRPNKATEWDHGISRIMAITLCGLYLVIFGRTGFHALSASMAITGAHLRYASHVIPDEQSWEFTTPTPLLHLRTPSSLRHGHFIRWPSFRARQTSRLGLDPSKGYSGHIAWARPSL